MRFDSRSFPFLFMIYATSQPPLSPFLLSNPRLGEERYVRVFLAWRSVRPSASATSRVLTELFPTLIRAWRTADGDTLGVPRMKRRSQSSQALLARSFPDPK